MRVSDRLRQERERLGHTQTEMAKVCGVGFRTYCDYEAGKTEPKASFFGAMSDAGADVMYIITGTKTPPVIISSEEQKLVENYRAMDEAAKLNIQAVGDSFAQSKPNSKLGNDNPRSMNFENNEL